MNDLSFRTEFKSQKYNSHFKFESDSKIYFPISTQQHEKYIEIIYLFKKIISIKKYISFFKILNVTNYI